MSNEVYNVTISIPMIIVVYAAIGFGISRLIASLESRKLSIKDVLLWPAVCIYYAFISKIPPKK